MGSVLYRFRYHLGMIPVLFIFGKFPIRASKGVFSYFSHILPYNFISIGHSTMKYDQVEQTDEPCLVTHILPESTYWGVRHHGNIG